MPWCNDCGVHLPVEWMDEDEITKFVRIAFHDFDCPARLLDAEGELDKYIFQGDILYEVQPDNSRIAISTFRGFPEPYQDSLASKGAYRTPLLSLDWEAFRKKYPAYTTAGERRVTTVQEDYYQTNKRPEPVGSAVVEPAWKTYRANHTNFSSSAPFESIDRKKWPRTWAWMLKFYFSSDYYKNVQFSHGYMGYGQVYGG